MPPNPPPLREEALPTPLRRDMAPRSSVSGFRHQGPDTPLSSGSLASRSSTEALCSSLWDSYSTTPDPDVVAAGVQFQHTIHDDAARHPSSRVHCHVLLSNLCESGPLLSLMAQATQGDKILLKLLQIQKQKPGLWEGSSLCLECRTRCSRIPVLAQDTQCPPCGQVDDPSCDHAAVCARARTATANTTRWLAFSTKQPKKRASNHREKKSGLLHLHSDSDGVPQRTSLDRPADGEDSIPEARDFAVTNCLRPVSRKPRTHNLSDYETLERTFHDTAHRRDQNGVRFRARYKFQQFGLQ